MMAGTGSTIEIKTPQQFFENFGSLLENPAQADAVMPAILAFLKGEFRISEFKEWMFKMFEMLGAKNNVALNIEIKQRIIIPLLAHLVEKKKIENAVTILANLDKYQTCFHLGSTSVTSLVDEGPATTDTPVAEIIDGTLDNILSKKAPTASVQAKCFSDILMMRASARTLQLPPSKVPLFALWLEKDTRREQEKLAAETAPDTSTRRVTFQEEVGQPQPVASEEDRAALAAQLRPAQIRRYFYETLSQGDTSSDDAILLKLVALREGQFSVSEFPDDTKVYLRELLKSEIARLMHIDMSDARIPQLIEMLPECNAPTDDWAEVLEIEMRCSKDADGGLYKFLHLEESHSGQLMLLIQQKVVDGLCQGAGGTEAALKRDFEIKKQKVKDELEGVYKGFHTRILLAAIPESARAETLAALPQGFVSTQPLHACELALLNKSAAPQFFGGDVGDPLSRAFGGYAEKFTKVASRVLLDHRVDLIPTVVAADCDRQLQAKAPLLRSASGPTETLIQTHFNNENVASYVFAVIEKFEGQHADKISRLSDLNSAAVAAKSAREAKQLADERAGKTVDAGSGSSEAEQQEERLTMELAQDFMTVLATEPLPPAVVNVMQAIWQTMQDSKPTPEEQMHHLGTLISFIWNRAIGPTLATHDKRKFGNLASLLKTIWAGFTSEKSDRWVGVAKQFYGLNRENPAFWAMVHSVIKQVAPGADVEMFKRFSVYNQIPKEERELRARPTLVHAGGVQEDEDPEAAFHEGDQQSERSAYGLLAERMRADERTLVDLFVQQGEDGENVLLVPQLAARVNVQVTAYFQYASRIDDATALGKSVAQEAQQQLFVQDHTLEPLVKILVDRQLVSENSATDETIQAYIQANPAHVRAFVQRNIYLAYIEQVAIPALVKQYLGPLAATSTATSRIDATDARVAQALQNLSVAVYELYEFAKTNFPGAAEYQGVKDGTATARTTWQQRMGQRWRVAKDTVSRHRWKFGFGTFTALLTGGLVPVGMMPQIISHWVGPTLTVGGPAGVLGFGLGGVRDWFNAKSATKQQIATAQEGFRVALEGQYKQMAGIEDAPVESAQGRQAVAMTERPTSAAPQAGSNPYTVTTTGKHKEGLQTCLLQPEHVDEQFSQLDADQLTTTPGYTPPAAPPLRRLTATAAHE